MIKSFVEFKCMHQRFDKELGLGSVNLTQAAAMVNRTLFTTADIIIEMGGAAFLSRKGS